MLAYNYVSAEKRHIECISIKPSKELNHKFHACINLKHYPSRKSKMKSVSYPRTGKRGVPQQFPRRLYNMLESEAQFQHMANKDTQIKWSDSGCAFNILDVNLFSTQVLPKYFRTNKFSSFQRNLNLVS